MDNENKPRMDYDTNTTLVSDVRLKRYIRDYFETNLGMPIFITNRAKDAKARGEQLKKENMVHTDLIDCRLFGAVFAESGDNKHLTGPVQFNWGYSLNPVELNESSTITSSFSSGQGVGKDFRVKYSLIAFSGGINAHTAKGTKLTADDIALFDEAMIAAIPAARTRSKTGQTPRFYLRVQATDNKLVLKDLREYLTLDYNTNNEYSVRSIDGITLDISRLHHYLQGFESRIENIVYWCDDNIKIKGLDELKAAFEGKLLEVDPAER